MNGGLRGRQLHVGRPALAAFDLESKILAAISALRHVIGVTWQDETRGPLQRCLYFVYLENWHRNVRTFWTYIKGVSESLLSLFGR